MHICYFGSPHIYGGMYNIPYERKQSSIMHVAPSWSFLHCITFVFPFLQATKAWGFRRINEELQVHKPTLRVCEVGWQHQNPPTAYFGCLLLWVYQCNLEILEKRYVLFLCPWFFVVFCSVVWWTVVVTQLVWPWLHATFARLYHRDL